MSLFPALKPTARSFVPGTVPVSSYKSLSGKETRIILGDTPVEHQISLTFSNIGEDAAGLILSHWYGREGIALSFALPGDVWAGWSTYASAVTAGQQWRYVEAPSVTSVSPSIMSIQVQLQSVI